MRTAYDPRCANLLGVVLSPGYEWTNGSREVVPWSRVDGGVGQTCECRWTVVNYQRIRRQQSLREAEGYLDLAMGFADQWPLPAALRVRLAQRALDALAPLSESTGQRAQILYLTGLAYRAMHRYAEAVPHLKAAAELDPENIPVWLALGWCYKRIDHLDDAIQSLESALAATSRRPSSTTIWPATGVWRATRIEPCSICRSRSTSIRAIGNWWPRNRTSIRSAICPIFRR